MNTLKLRSTARTLKLEAKAVGRIAHALETALATLPEGAKVEQHEVSLALEGLRSAVRKARVRA